MNHTHIWTHEIGERPLLAVALHQGHELRAEVEQLMALSPAERLRHEDPYTGSWAEAVPTRFVVHRSRFEMDLNRPRQKAVCGTAEDSKGMRVWKVSPTRAILDTSIAQYDAFYEALKSTLAAWVRAGRCFVIYDLHTCGAGLGGRGADADPTPEVQVSLGMGRISRKPWAPVVDAFVGAMAHCTCRGRPVEVREEVKFKGGQLARWVRENFSSRGCVLPIDVRTTTMNESALADLREAFASTVDPVLAALRSVESARKLPQKRTFSIAVGRALRLGLVVNDVQREQAGYTTTRLAMMAKQMGHEVYVMGVGDLAYDADEKIRAHAVTVPKRVYKNGAAFLKDLQGPRAVEERVTVDDLDVLLLRNDPAEDAVARPWAAQAGILFGRIAMRHGVVVLNDPNGLAKATSKMYFQTFPAEIRPETIITRNRDDLRAFARERGTVVLKPLTGSGGQSVFLIRPEDLPNINQMIDSVSRDGFVIAQEYLPAAEEGDTRLFMVNGEAFKYRGKYAAFRRVRKGGDLRSNLHAGGGLARGDIGPDALELVEMVRPKLIQDGMFMVGLDIVGRKLMEINVFSPGGLGSAQKFEGVNFTEGVIKALERKTQAMTYYRRQFDNIGMATI